MLTLLAIGAGQASSDPITVDTKGLPPRSVMQFKPAMPVPEWLQNSVRIGHLPPVGWRMLDEYLKSGYNIVTINANGAFYKVGPTAHLFPEAEVKAADEYMRRIVETTHKAGARSIFYIGPDQGPMMSKEFYTAHPDWLKVRYDGSNENPPNFANIRSGYADWVLKQLAYLVKEYKVDGFWFDGYAPVHLHTYDEATKKAFREFSGGKEIPLPLDKNPESPAYFDIANDPLAKQYMDWHERYFVDFAQKMRDAVRGANPEAVIFVNHSANRTWYFPNMYMGEYPGAYGSAIDVSSVEFYWDVPGDPLYHQFGCAFMQDITGERGATVWIQPSAHGITGIASPVEIQLRGLECIGWGVYPEFVESSGREEYQRMNCENLKARDKWLVKSKTVPYIGIYASEQTRNLYARGALPLYFGHTLGAFKAITEKHWPVRILSEYDIEDGNFHGVKVLMMPDVACLSDRACEVIRRFVKNGGGLVATFETSLYDTDFKRRPDFALGDLFRAKYLASNVVTQRVENLYLTLDAKHPIIDDPIILAKQNTGWAGGDAAPPEKGSIALVASATECQALDGGNVISTYIGNDPKRGPNRYPAIITSEFGKGRVVYFPTSVDKGLFFYPDSYQREMIANACFWASGDQKPPFEVEAPLILTTTFRTQPAEKRYIVHLTNNASSWGQHSIYQKLAALPEELEKQWGFPAQSELRGTWPIREEIIPLHDVKVICRMPGVKKATQQPENVSLPITKTADGVEVTVPKIGMHSMVVFE